MSLAALLPRVCVLEKRVRAIGNDLRLQAARISILEAGDSVLKKPAHDTHRIQTAVDNAFGPAEIFICAWVKFDEYNGSDTIFWGINSAVRGAWLQITADGLGVRFTYTNAVGTNVFTTHAAHNIPAGEWAWWYGGVDDTGNIVVGVNGAETTASNLAPKTTGNVDVGTILHRTGGTVGFSARASIADFRFYDVLPDADQRQNIRFSGRLDGHVDGIVSHLTFQDGALGDDTDDWLPVDLVKPSRLWVVAGAGEAYTYLPRDPLDPVRPLAMRAP